MAFEDKMMATLFAFVGLLFVGFLGFGAYEASNWMSLPERSADGRIQEVQFLPQHTCGGVKTRHTCADSWFVHIKSPVGEDFARIMHPPWDWMQAGSPVHITYHVSRWSREFSILTFAPGA